MTCISTFYWKTSIDDQSLAKYYTITVEVSVVFEIFYIEQKNIAIEQE